MERQMCRLLLTVLVLLVLNSALAQNINSYSEVGGTLVLTPPFSGHINHILWKHGANLAAEWYIGELDYYGMFRGRTTLNTTTGCLEIKDMTESYAGLYTVEINNRPQSQGYNVEVINRLSKPEVVRRPLTCSTASDSCTLSCDGNTSGAGPVTYSWKKDGQSVQEGKVKTIMNNVETKSIKTFSCQMKNPVSVKESDPHQNPFFQEEPPPSPVVVLVLRVLAFLGALAAAGVLYWKRESIF
ncbi:lymphocyte function-associated antigen 3-like [Trachinotus anak]|uniref:lymphocyte function-associated antigen 3-like n=1 Tax=Trachinotus anak TaxID=443729 RepID=UPI0039F1BF05